MLSEQRMCFFAIPPFAIHGILSSVSKITAGLSHIPNPPLLLYNIKSSLLWNKHDDTLYSVPLVHFLLSSLLRAYMLSMVLPLDSPDLFLRFSVRSSGGPGYAVIGPILCKGTIDRI